MSAPRRLIGPLSKKPASETRRVGGMGLLPSLANNLTFGIELEFQAECPYAIADSLAGHQQIADRLSEGGMKIKFFPEELECKGTSEDYNEWIIENDVSIETIHRTMTWNADKRASTALIGVELKSRILKNEPESFKEIKWVCDRLHAGFVTSTDISTGHHLHVGNGKDGFSLPTLKAFASIVIAFEPFINQIHPVDRTRQSSVEFLFCKELSMSAGFDGATNTKDRLYRIQKVESLLDFVQLVNGQRIGFIVGYASRGDRNHAYNFTNLLKTGGKKGIAFKPTIEFRQHQGTTDPDSIVSWAKLALALVRFSQTATSTMLDHLLEQAESSAFGLHGLMREIGCPQLWEYYRTRLHRHPSLESRPLRQPVLPSVTMPETPQLPGAWFDDRRAPESVYEPLFASSLCPVSSNSGPSWLPPATEESDSSPGQPDTTSHFSIFTQGVPDPIEEEASKDEDSPSKGVKKVLERVDSVVNHLQLQRSGGEGSRTLKAMLKDRGYQARPRRDSSSRGRSAQRALDDFRSSPGRIRPGALDPVREYGEASSEADLELLRPQARPRFPNLHRSRWTERSVLRDRVVRARSRSPTNDDSIEMEEGGEVAAVPSAFPNPDQDSPVTAFRPNSWQMINGQIVRIEVLNELGDAVEPTLESYDRPDGEGIEEGLVTSPRPDDDDLYSGD